VLVDSFAHLAAATIEGPVNEIKYLLIIKIRILHRLKQSDSILNLHFLIVYVMPYSLPKIKDIKFSHNSYCTKNKLN